MKKVFITLLVIFGFILPSNSKVITGEIQYSANTARDEVFTQKAVSFDRETIKANIYDYNKAENQIALLKGVTELKDRTLALFSDGSYGVIYKQNPLDVFYYNSDGILTHNEKKDSLNYPYKSYKYTTNGKPVNMSLRVSEDETFIFEPNGKLIAHWLGVCCYDEDNNIIMKRKILK